MTKLEKGVNDLKTINPKLAVQWHPTKNGDLKPDMVTAISSKKVWWYLPYDDPETGKHFDFEWEEFVFLRNRGYGCPYLTGRAVWPGFNDLATKNPEVAKEWDYEENQRKHDEDIANGVKNPHPASPEDVTQYCNISVFWKKTYDDPRTKKHFDFTWSTPVFQRTRGSDCPYLAGQAVWPGFNDLATKNPELAKEWDYEKNQRKHDEDIANGVKNPHPARPENAISSSTFDVFWKLPYDDPKTGKHFDFTWKSKVYSRARGVGCPYLSGHSVWPGFNDLATQNPEWAKEWDYEKNQKKHDEDIANGIKKPHPAKPEDAIYGGTTKIFWKLPYDDPETGKHFDFTWESSIYHRKKGHNFPYLSGHAVWPGFNDLATKNPEAAKEWDYEENQRRHDEDIANGVKNPHPARPEDVTYSSAIKVSWKLPYDDPETGKHFDFTWESSVSHRNKGYNCPYLSGHAVWPGFNDLATKNPELAKEWDYEENQKKHDEDIANGVKNPHPARPENVTYGSAIRVSWKLPYDDPETGKHFDFTWESVISNRFNGFGCPYLSGHAVWPGFNDLATKSPELAKEWDYKENQRRHDEDVANGIKNPHPAKPEDVTPTSNIKVSWKYPYDDPETGKHFDFTWESVISNRFSGLGCPYLSGQAVWPGFNDLATKNPEVAKEWDYEENQRKHDEDIANGVKNPHPARPEDVTQCCNISVFWKKPYDDPRTKKHFDFTWSTPVCQRARGRDCPYLAGQAVWLGFNDLVTRNPELAKEWDYEENQRRHDEDVVNGIKNPHPARPEDVVPGSAVKASWVCEEFLPEIGKVVKYKWDAEVASRNKGYNCPYLKSKESKLMQIITEVCVKNNIEFEKEKKFDELRDQYKLPFDLFINNNIVIEVDGEQHSEPVRWSKESTIEETMKRLEGNILHDNMKNKYCVENNIPILRIPYKPLCGNFYNIDGNIEKEKIEKIVLEFIKNKTVPAWIKNHYSIQYFNTKQTVMDFLEKNNASQELLDKYKNFDFSSNYVECVKKIESSSFFALGQDILVESPQQTQSFNEGFHPEGVRRLLEDIFADVSDDADTARLSDISLNNDLDDFSI